MVSYWSGPPPAENAWGDRLLLVDGRGLPLARRLWRRVPERFRGIRSNGISGRDTLTYAWKAIDLAVRLRPRVIVCYDGRKLGRLLRSAIDWPCRLVLAQRGFSYYLDPAEADRLYSLASFDLVWTMTRASYRFDRDRSMLYEPSVHLLANGIDVEAFRAPATSEDKQRARRAFDLPLDRPIVLLLARLVPKKGAHLVVEAWDRVVAEVPDALLWIVGGGANAYVDRLLRTSRALGVEGSVRIHGAVPPERTPASYRAADLFVFPTLWGEGQARSLLEAMASGLPCVVSDRPEARETYAEDEVLFVEDPNFHGQFVGPIVSLLKDPETRRALGERARRAAVGRFSEADRITDLTALLKEQVRLVGPRT